MNIHLNHIQSRKINYKQLLTKCQQSGQLSNIIKDSWKLHTAPTVSKIKFQIEESKDRLKSQVSFRVNSIQSDGDGEFDELKEQIENNTQINGGEFEGKHMMNGHTDSTMQVELAPMPVVNQQNMVPMNSYSTPGFDNDGNLSSSDDNNNIDIDARSQPGGGGGASSSENNMDMYNNEKRKTIPDGPGGENKVNDDIIAAINGTHNGYQD